jgi:hypothetical protein
MERFETRPQGLHLVKGLAVGWIVFWVAYIAVKIAMVPIIIVNIIWLVQACQHNTVGTFDFTWLIISVLGFLFL